MEMINLIVECVVGKCWFDWARGFILKNGCWESNILINTPLWLRAESLVDGRYVAKTRASHREVVVALLYCLIFPLP